MTNFARLLAQQARRRARAVLPLAGVLAASAALSATLLASPAAAEVTTVGFTKVGLQPTNQISYFDGLFEHRWNAELGKEGEFELISAPGPETFRNPSGNPVVHGANVFAVYWDPEARYNPDWQHLIDGFLHEMGEYSSSLSSVFAVDEQYRDGTNAPISSQYFFRHAYTDTHHYPAGLCKSPAEEALHCLTANQVRNELASYIASNNLPTGMHTIYYVMTPPAVTVCIDEAASRCSEFERTPGEVIENKFESESYEKAFCSYHELINPTGAPDGDEHTILFGVVPWTAGSAGVDEFDTLHGQAAYCQDGGFDPSSKQPIEQRERKKPRTAQEQKEFLEKTPQEQEEIEKESSLQGPHDQEPNQQPCPNLGDGACDAGLGDLIVNQIAIEQQNIATDPLLDGWQDEGGKEVTDECRNFFATAKLNGGSSANPESGAGTLSNQSYREHDYYLNTVFNLASELVPYPGIPCLVNVSLVPRFTSPNVVNTGEVIGLDGMESVVTLDGAYSYAEGVKPTYAKFKWEFGDGSAPVEGYAPGTPVCEAPWLSPCAGSVQHSYQYGGTYQATLTVTDVAGNVASVTHPVVVNGPAAPSSGGGGGGGGGEGGGGSSGGSGSTSSGSGSPSSAGSASAGSGAGSGGSTTHPVPVPVAAAAVVPRSLRLLRKGLVIRYSVNEQVAGRVEILLSRTLAKRLHISGPAAVGLPVGTAPQVVIGKALLVTTAPGRSTVTIQLSKHTAARLARLHSVTMMMRMFVRNAASHLPATTTLLSSFTLTR